MPAFLSGRSRSPSPEAGALRSPPPKMLGNGFRQPARKQPARPSPLLFKLHALPARPQPLTIKAVTPAKLPLLTLPSLVSSSTPDASPHTDPAPAYEENSSLKEHFEILTKIENAIFGSVLKARRRADGKLVAIKQLSKERVRRRRSVKDTPVYENAQMELTVLQKAAEAPHPNVLRALAVSGTKADVLHDSASIYCITPFCDCGELFQTIRAAGALSVREGLRLFRQILQGVQHLHAVLGFVHNDISPENIFLRSMERVESGSTSSETIPVLADFGLAAEIGRPAPRTPGKTTYQAPEVLFAGGSGFGARAAAASSDVFSLGVLLFVMLTGVLPYDRPQASTDPKYAALQSGAQEFSDAIALWDSVPCNELVAHYPKLVRLICEMTRDDPRERPSVPDVMNAVRGARTSGKFPPSSVALGALSRDNQSASSRMQAHHTHFLTQPSFAHPKPRERRRRRSCASACSEQMRARLDQQLGLDDSTAVNAMHRSFSAKAPVLTELLHRDSHLHPRRSDGPSAVDTSHRTVPSPAMDDMKSDALEAFAQGFQRGAIEADPGPSKSAARPTSVKPRNRHSSSREDEQQVDYTTSTRAEVMTTPTQRRRAFSRAPSPSLSGCLARASPSCVTDMPFMARALNDSGDRRRSSCYAASEKETHPNADTVSAARELDFGVRCNARGLLSQHSSGTSATASATDDASSNTPNGGCRRQATLRRALKRTNNGLLDNGDLLQHVLQMGLQGNTNSNVTESRDLNLASTT